MTELVSADAIAHFVAKKQDARNKLQANHKSQIIKFKTNSTYKLMEFRKAEMPIVVQLFGKHPEKFAVAAKWIEENLKPAGIDINMGCPAKKVVGSDHGATLLRDQERGVAVVKAVREATRLPLSVKTRLGWERDDEILEFAPKLIAAGADALIIHGRTYKDGFSGQARWENIYQVKNEVRSKNYGTIVIGNGDIREHKDINKRLKNLDGVAIGRGAVGNPFVFNKEYIGLSEEKKIDLKKKNILEQAGFALNNKGEKGIIELRKHLLSYFRGHKRAKELRKEFVKVKNLSDIKLTLNKI